MRLFSFCAFILLTGCEFPTDPNNTLNRVSSQTLQVGYAENPPWTMDSYGNPIGQEPKLVKLFANHIHSKKIDWKKGSVEELLLLLEEKKLDMVIGGLSQDTPWKERKIALTRPYTIDRKGDKRVFAVQQGENRFLMELEKFILRQGQIHEQ